MKLGEFHALIRGCRKNVSGHLGHCIRIAYFLFQFHVIACLDDVMSFTIVLPWGKFEDQKLQMGLCNSPNIFLEKMNELFNGLEYGRAYINDLLIISNGNFEDHLNKVKVVLKKLKPAGLKINADKSFFARDNLEYLDFKIAR